MCNDLYLYTSIYMYYDMKYIKWLSKDEFEINGYIQ